MADVVVFGITGEPGLWLADIKSGTVTPVEEPLKGGMAEAATFRKQGITVSKGVDFAIAVSSAADVAAGLHEG